MFDSLNLEQLERINKLIDSLMAKEINSLLKKEKELQG